MKTISELAIDGLSGFAVSAFKSGFADAENRGQTVAKGSGDFLGDIFFALVENVAAFGMANNGVIDESANLSDGRFAGVGAIITPVNGDLLGAKAVATTP